MGASETQTRTDESTDESTDALDEPFDDEIPWLDGRVVVLIGADGEPTAGIASGLVGAGATVGLVGGAEVLDLATAIDREPGGAVPIAARLGDRAAIDDAFTVATDVLRHIDAVVLTAYPPPALTQRALVDLDEPAWDASCEQVLRTTLFVLQGAYRSLHERGGRIVLVTPTIAMTGAGGLAPLAAATEGQRALAKSAARAWGAREITVNCIAPSLPPETVGALRLGLDDAALGDTDPERDLAPIAAFLVSDDSHSLTGATLVADGGVWMGP